METAAKSVAFINLGRNCLEFLHPKGTMINIKQNGRLYYLHNVSSKSNDLEHIRVL